MNDTLALASDMKPIGPFNERTWGFLFLWVLGVAVPIAILIGWLFS